MRRRRNRSAEQTVSLFPFLSILACVIGVLTLMICAVALGQLDQPEGKSAERAEDYQKLQAQIETQQEQVDQFRLLLARAAKFRDAAEELKRLESLQTTQATDKALSITLLAQANRLQKRIDELNGDPDYKQIQIELAKLQAELDRRKAPPNEAQVVVKPGGSGTGLIPTFVECTKTGLVIYDGAEPQRVRRADLGKDATWLKMLDRLAENENSRVIFLLRDDAINTYNQARGIARSRYCRNGKLPLIGHGRIDLSIFEK